LKTTGYTTSTLSGFFQLDPTGITPVLRKKMLINFIPTPSAKSDPYHFRLPAGVLPGVALEFFYLLVSDLI
jgi:hypothetical protein